VRWSFDPGFDAASKAALEAGKPLVYECAPAVWMAAPLFRSFESKSAQGCHTLVLVPDCGIVPELAAYLNADRHTGAPDEAAEYVLPASGLARAAVALRTQSAPVLVATPDDAYALLTRSAFKTDNISRTVLMWPELFTPAEGKPVELLLGDLGSAQRVIVTEDAPGVSALTERYARRAPTMHAVSRPAGPGAGIRGAVVAADRVSAAVVAVLDAFAPRNALVWDPFPNARARWIDYEADPTVELVTGEPPKSRAEVVIATDLPSPDVLDMLRDLADRVVVLHRPYQVGSLGRMSDPVREISVSPEADRARRAAIELRTDLRSQLGRADLTGEMLQLAPLFDEYDPAAVAAALVRRSGGGGGVAPTGTSYPSWVRIRLDLGKRDRIKAGDIVGALINAAHTPKDHVGHIDLRETFTVVEVRTESAEAAFRALGEITLRGRPAKPQIDTK